MKNIILTKINIRRRYSIVNIFLHPFILHNMLEICHEFARYVLAREIDGIIINYFVE